MSQPNHRRMMELYCFGLGDSICARWPDDDKDFHASRFRHLFWRMQGRVLMILFGWWKWVDA